MEWTRRRWGVVKQAILLGGERFAGLLGDVIIADHPEIAVYLRRHFGKRRVATIAYGAHPVDDAPDTPVRGLGLHPGQYATVICRPIPENSLVEIVSAWSRTERGMPLVVLGNFDETDSYHRQVLDAAGDEVVFPGAIYDHDIVGALRFHSRLYLHGHTVGGTNPSLVEAMAASNAVVAHRNKYNTWVAGDGARYFDDVPSLADTLDVLIDDIDTLRTMQQRSRERFEAEFTWARIGGQYEDALRTAMARRAKPVAPGLERAG